MRHSKSRFIESRSEDPDIPGDARRVRTGAVRKPHLPAPIISLPRFIGGIATEGRKCLFIFRIHHKLIKVQYFPIAHLGNSSIIKGYFRKHSKREHPVYNIGNGLLASRIGMRSLCD